MKKLSTLDKSEIEQLCRRAVSLEEVVQRIKPIIEDVMKRGDKAIVEYTKKFDNVEIESVKLELDELKRIATGISPQLKEAIDRIMEHVIDVNKIMVQKERIYIKRGVIITFKPIPLDRPGIYIPKNYVSTLIMLTSIAHVAGCREIVVATPPLPNGKVSEAFAYVVCKLPNCQLFVGNGVACIAAMAYGTESIPQVDKLFGPGNIYIQAAKYLVSTRVEIDGIEGPTELVLYIDTVDENKVKRAIYDVLAELEHGVASIAVVLSKSESTLLRFEQEYEQVKHGKNLGVLTTLLVDNEEQVVEFVNKFAPEHFEIITDDVKRVKKILRNAKNVGVVSLNTSCTYLDYCAGPCHVLPTSGFARGRGTLTPLDFMKWVAIVENYDKDLVRYGKELAEVENMQLHKRSLELLEE